MSASTQIISDLNTAATATYSATAQAAAIAAAGPIMDLNGVLKACTLKAQEIAVILNYVLGGSAITAASYTAPTGGVVTSSSDSTNYNLLVGVYQLLK
jgi:hypothetical protein